MSINKIKAMVGSKSGPAYPIPAVFNVAPKSEVPKAPAPGCKRDRLVQALRKGTVVGGKEYPGIWAIIPEWRSTNPARLVVEALNKIRGYGYGFRYDPETDTLYLRDPEPAPKG